MNDFGQYRTNCIVLLCLHGISFNFFFSFFLMLNGEALEEVA